MQEYLIMHTESGPPAIMVALYSRDPDYFLLIKNTKEEMPWWKFIGETLKEGESDQEALVRASWEEAGFMLRVDDPELRIAEVRPPRQVLGKRLHTQYFYKVCLPYPRLRDLSCKKFPGKDPDEFFHTQVFSFADAGSMPSFFPLHRPLYKEFLGYTV